MGFPPDDARHQGGEPDVGLRTLNPVEDLLPLIFSSLWVTHLAEYGFDYIVSVHIPSPTISGDSFLCIFLSPFFLGGGGWVFFFGLFFGFWLLFLFVF